MRAKTARHLTLTENEEKELLAIKDVIKVACSHHKRTIEYLSFSSYLVWDILEKDYGYTVSITGKVAVISW